jgi:CubicO group peptidase (beta-lactamase class C family)
VADHFFASDDLISTPRDYARFVVGILQKQGVAPDLYLEREKLQTVRLTQTCMGDAPGCAAEDGFGLGWETFLIGGRRFLVHTGMDDGTFTFVYLEPETGAGLVMFTNSKNGWKAVLPVLELTGADAGFIAHLRSSIS